MRRGLHYPAGVPRRLTRHGWPLPQPLQHGHSIAHVEPGIVIAAMIITGASGAGNSTNLQSRTSGDEHSTRLTTITKEPLEQHKLPRGLASRRVVITVSGHCCEPSRQNTAAAYLSMSSGTNLTRSSGDSAPLKCTTTRLCGSSLGPTSATNASYCPFSTAASRKVE